MQINVEKPQTVSRVRREDFERKHLEQCSPIIITDALSDWNAARVWSPPYLAAVLKNKQVIVAVSKEDRFNYNPLQGDAEDAPQFGSDVMDFGSLVSRVCNPELLSEHYYVMQKSIPNEFPELLPDIKVPKWIESNQPVINLWFGTAENVTPLHYDKSNNFFAQVYGRKRVTLFDPMQTELLYPYPFEAEMSHVSFVDIEEPDFTKYPEFRKARPLECVLEPGELLFLPAFWWHHVRSLEVAISVNFWWPPDFRQNFLPNAIRGLPLLYEQDRLTNVKANLINVGLDFLKAARLLNSRGQRWAAILLAGAALEEFVRSLSRSYGIPERSHQALRPLLTINSELQAADVYAWADARKIAAYAEMINTALAADNSLFSDKEVVSFINGVSLLISQ
jgi:jumonji domain-containing protein 7